METSLIHNEDDRLHRSRESSERRKAMETMLHNEDEFFHGYVGKAVNAERQWRHRLGLVPLCLYGVGKAVNAERQWRLLL